jgi:hypothetical protein
MVDGTIFFLQLPLIGVHFFFLFLPLTLLDFLKGFPVDPSAVFRSPPPSARRLMRLPFVGLTSPFFFPLRLSLTE